MSVVQAGYRHLTKAIVPAAPIAFGETVLKWYDIAPADQPVPGPVQRLGARRRLARAAGLEPLPPLAARGRRAEGLRARRLRG
jgi:hypothetical protein